MGGGVGRVRRWTSEDISKLIMMRNVGLTFEAIANLLDRSIHACHTKYYNCLDHPDFKRSKHITLQASQEAIVSRLNQRYNNKHVMSLVKYLMEEEGFEIDETGVWTETGHWPIKVAIGNDIQVSFNRLTDKALVWVSGEGELKIYTPVEP